MPSSISSSNDRMPKGNCCKQWILVILIFLVLSLALESLLRYRGKLPTVKDSPEFWSYWRSKSVNKFCSDDIICLGASRIHLGLNLAELKRKVICENVYMLAIDDTNAFIILKDLAENSIFNGTVIYSLFPWLLLHKIDDANAAEYLSYYQDNVKKSMIVTSLDNIEIYIRAKFEERFVLFSSSFPEIATCFFKEILSCRSMYYDRSGVADFEKLSNEDILRIKSMLLDRIGYSEERMKDYSPDNLLLWQDCVEHLVVWSNIIENRGGKVVFVKFPSTGEYWDLEQKQFPKEKFWDSSKEILQNRQIHFLDIYGTDKLECPDTSHLNYDSAVKFTDILADELIKRGILKSRISSVDFDKAN